MSIIEEISKCKIEPYSSINFLTEEIWEASNFILSGYNPKSSFITLDEESKNIINNILTHHRHIDKLNGMNARNLEELERVNNKRYKRLYDIQINKGKIFLNSYFILHKVYQLDSMCQIIHESPFNIQIITEEDGFIGGLIKHRLTDISNDNLQQVFHNIYLPRVISSALPAIYSHEIMHAQTFSRFGSIVNIFNSEVISIFVELLYIDDTNNKKANNIMLNERINILKNRIKFLNNDTSFSMDKFNAMIYYASTVTAYKLYNIYQKGNILVKKEIITNIQSIIDGRFTLEDILDKYDLNWTKKRTMNS